MTDGRQSAVSPQSGAMAPSGGRDSTNLGDILERVLDRGLVIVGDIRISLLDIELLTIKLRLLVASVDTARQLGIDWWEHDPWLTSAARTELPDSQRSGEIDQSAEENELEAGDEDETASEDDEADEEEEES
ncbi:gas vesicle protein [Glycomyces luteolus]|uniref:Gas vesicle protein n=1 Tax=Glycomyces luteolus TaxID=2670330 RepID=A0A9X3P9V6_9ACTN|nr:gas vesicle protein GvpJ [Glycomyces luteolus]MDA1360714.1 gas vesicle protein [Glycomyces luteolus]